MKLRAKIYDWLRRNTSAKTRQWFKRQGWFMPVAHRVFAADVYSDSYYADVERLEKGSINYIAEWVKQKLKPARMIDVGCGPGHMMEAFQQHGISAYGVDISASALQRVKKRGLQASRFDLTDPASVLPGIPYDLAVSCEVAEHLEEKYASGFVMKLCHAADTVYLTAAETDPAVGPGMMHFNEQPNSYWIALFDQQGFQLDQEATSAARRYYQEHQVISYLAKPMIFRKRKKV